MVQINVKGTIVITRTMDDKAGTDSMKSDDVNSSYKLSDEDFEKMESWLMEAILKAEQEDDVLGGRITF